MKILVAVKRVIDYQVKIRVKSDESAVDTDHVKMSINPFDEIAVEEAIRLREKGIASEVIVVSLGVAQCEETLRAALALGADRAILVETEQTLEPLHVAKLLQAIVNKEQPQLVITGKQAIDDDCNQVGQMLAGLLNWPQATFASALEVTDQQLQVIREVDGGLATINVALPAVVTTDLRLNEPRYTNMMNIMKAKQKPFERMTPDQLDVALKPHLETLSVTAPAKRQAGIKVDNFAQLVEKLQQTVGVFKS